MITSERAKLPLIEVMKNPIFSSLSEAVAHEDSDYYSSPACTDGQTIFYSKELEDFSFEEKVGIIAQQLLTINFEYKRRSDVLLEKLGTEYSHLLFGISTNAVANEAVRKEGYTLPKSVFYLTDILKRHLEIDVSIEDALSRWDVESLYMALAKTDILKNN